MIGSAYFQRMLNIWDGNVPLAVASYNAGSGNVGKWVRRYGDPRGQVDVVAWIEAIPYRRDARLCAARDRKQRRLRFDALYAAATDRDSCLALSWEEPPG